MQLKEHDRRIVNIINSSMDEYVEEKMCMDSVEIYWSLSAVRRESVLFYPLEADADILIVGDKFGALTGAVCEKTSSVDTIVPSQLYADAVNRRYQSRNNLHVYLKSYDDWDMNKQYPYVLVNLEYADGFDMNDTYGFDCLLNPAVKHLEENGKLLITAYGDRQDVIHKLLYRLGFVYQKQCDPLGNGALFVEASRMDNLSDYDPPSVSPMLKDRWIRKHDFPRMGGKLYDQDQALIDKVKKVQIELLEKLLNVCTENGLRVYPIYGTLLGIVRDGGMIPGDDDIDVAMPREDYDKLMQLSGQFDGKFFLQTPYCDDCFFGGYSKLRNSETTAIHPQNEFVDCNEGISIDIFPIDKAFTNKSRENRKLRSIRFLQRLLYAKSYGYFRQFKDMKMLQWKAYRYIGKMLDRNKMIDMLYKEMRSCDSFNQRGAIYCHYQNGKITPVYINLAVFQATTPLLYEGIFLDVPAGWNELLGNRYGEGYMESLDFMEWKRRHGFYDVSEPYSIYKKRFGGLKYPASIQESVVLIGDGSLFKACLNYYIDRVHVSHLVQLPGETPMKSVMGIKVYQWEEFLKMKLEESKYRLVICSGDAREAERIMKQAGFCDYYIFWENREWMLYANQSFIWKEIREVFK